MSGADVYPFVVDLVGRRLARDKVVLEVGCGAMQYAELVPGRYIGLDVEDSTHSRRTPDVVANVEAIPLADESVDVVFGVATFYLVHDVVAAFSECRRVLRPGGVLLVFDYQPDVLRALARAGDPVRHVWDADALSKAIQRGGFAAGAVRDRSFWARRQGPGRVAVAGAAVRHALRPQRAHWLVVEARRS